MGAVPGQTQGDSHAGVEPSTLATGLSQMIELKGIWRVCMCLHPYVHVCRCVCVYMHVCMRLRAHVHVYTRVYVYAHVCLCAHVFALMGACTHRCM